ncbi:hypothetical protein ABZ835_46710 [Streptomyces sp. NPDC047461]|uniref:hypothetical protein n=1 Tax=Streptomyces sp. NPDC047461 TaxID=3155619 RepID=UPI0033E04919
MVAHPDDKSFGLGGLLALLPGGGGQLHPRSGAHPARQVRASCTPAAQTNSPAPHRSWASSTWNGPAIRTALSSTSRCPGSPRRRAVRSAGSAPAARSSTTRERPQGGPDPRQATGAALLAAHRPARAVPGWNRPQQVTDRLNAEPATSFTGRGLVGWHAVAVVEPVPRERQDRPLACHAGQPSDSPVLRHRLELPGDREYLRFLE